MKQVINGKPYDTDTATEVGKWENVAKWGPYGDYTKHFIILYVTANGRYFLYTRVKKKTVI